MSRDERYQFSSEQEQKMSKLFTSRYNSLSIERKDVVRSMMVQIPNLCGGRLTLKGHRLEMELVVYERLNEEDCYGISDYTEDELVDVSSVWFFEIYLVDKSNKSISINNIDTIIK